MASIYCDGVAIIYSDKDGTVSDFEYFGKIYRLDRVNRNGFTDEQIDDKLAEIIDRNKWNIGYSNKWPELVIRLHRLGKLDIYRLMKVEKGEV